MTSLLQFSMTQWRQIPEMRIEDAYKWLFHATQGGEHAIYQPKGPRQILDREWKSLTAPRPGEKLIQPLRPDGKIVRLNLRPYKAKGGQVDPLFTAFVASAKSFKADRTEFKAIWNELGEALKKKPLSPYLTRATWEALDKETSGRYFPPVDHSKEFVQKTAPAYRVLTGDEAKRLTGQ